MEAERLIRVFLADGSRDCSELLRAALEQEGDIAVVGTACRGDEALARFPESGAELLLTELLLPGMDGLSLLHRLREAEALPHAIVLSGFFNDRIARAVSALADNYLAKPCRTEDLARCIRECVLGGGEARPFLRDDAAAVTRALIDCGVMPHLDGFRYLRAGLLSVLADRSLLQGVTKNLYRDIAKRFATTPVCVERSIRSAVERAWQHTSPAERRARFGALFDPWEQAPSNVPFLSAMTEYLENGLEPTENTRRFAKNGGKRTSFD